MLTILFVGLAVKQQTAAWAVKSPSPSWVIVDGAVVGVEELPVGDMSDILQHWMIIAAINSILITSDSS